MEQNVFINQFGNELNEGDIVVEYMSGQIIMDGKAKVIRPVIGAVVVEGNQQKIVEILPGLIEWQDQPDSQTRPIYCRYILASYDLGKVHFSKPIDEHVSCGNIYRIGNLDGVIST